MYKSKELYPQRGSGCYEKLIMTRGTTRRFSLFWEQVSSRKITLHGLSKLTGYSYSALQNYKCGSVVASLERYLHLMKLLSGWTGKKTHNMLYSDPNYWYATVKYPPETIRHRIKRLGLPMGNNMPHNVGYALIARELGTRPEKVYASVNYTEHRSSCMYGQIMYWLHDQEIRHKFPDYLRIEQ